MRRWNVCSSVILWALNQLKPVGEWAAEVRGVSVTCVCTALCFPKEPGPSEEDQYSIKKHFKLQVGIKEKSLGRNLKEIEWKETQMKFQKTQVWSLGSFNGNRKILTCKKRSSLLKKSPLLCFLERLSWSEQKKIVHHAEAALHSSHICFLAKVVNTWVRENICKMLL